MRFGGDGKVQDKVSIQFGRVRKGFGANKNGGLKAAVSIADASDQEELVAERAPAARLRDQRRSVVLAEDTRSAAALENFPVDLRGRTDAPSGAEVQAARDSLFLVGAPMDVRGSRVAEVRHGQLHACLGDRSRDRCGQRGKRDGGTRQPR